MALHGDADPSIVRDAVQSLKEVRTPVLYSGESYLSSPWQYREKQAVRLCLKHLRQFDYEEAFGALQKKACVELEHHLLSTLHFQLVETGDYSSAEASIQHAVDGE